MRASVEGQIFVKVTYTTGRDAGVEVFLPVWPSPANAWRQGIAA